MARPTTSTRRYAEAAFELALRDDNVDLWLRQLERAAGLSADEASLDRLSDPSVPFNVRAAALAGALGDDAVPQLRNLLLLLMRRRRLSLVAGVAADFRRLYNRRAGVVEATATVAAPLSDEDMGRLRQRIAEVAGQGRQVDLQLAIDPALLGGLTVRLGDTLIDGSVRGRLERLRNQLAART
jgi:F-type H+-transporting ATPase subunit delta